MKKLRWWLIEQLGGIIYEQHSARCGEWQDRDDARMDRIAELSEEANQHKQNADAWKRNMEHLQRGLDVLRKDLFQLRVDADGEYQKCHKLTGLVALREELFFRGLSAGLGKSWELLSDIVEPKRDRGSDPKRWSIFLAGLPKLGNDQSPDLTLPLTARNNEEARRRATHEGELTGRLSRFDRLEVHAQASIGHK